MRSRQLLVLSVFWLCASVGGCAQSAPPPRFLPSGFVGGEDAYTIAYAATPAPGQLLPGRWRVTNFAGIEKGLPERAKEQGVYESTLTWTYGSGSTGTVTTRTYDVVLSEPSEGTVWIRVLPLPIELRGKTNRVLAEYWVAHLNGNFYNDFLGGGSDEVRLATQIMSSAPTRIGGRGAHEVVFDVANVDQLQMDPNAPRTRVKIVVSAGVVWKTLEKRNDSFRVPGLLLIGYSNSAAQFDSLLPQVNDLVQRIRLTPPKS